MKISEIFLSIDGEGIRTGYPVIFIRAHNCNLRCSYCDSLYAVDGDEYTEMSVDEIMDEVVKYTTHRITFTGGEPLIQKDALDLIKRLVRGGYEVNIETNGSVDLSCVRDPSWCFGLMKDNIIITMDWKSITSNMSQHMRLGNLKHLTSNDALKFVVGSTADLEQMKELVTTNELKCNIFVSPIFGQIEPSDIVKYVLDNDLNNVRVQLQIHKIIWDSNMRGV